MKRRRVVLWGGYRNDIQYNGLEDRVRVWDRDALAAIDRLSVRLPRAGDQPRRTDGHLRI